ncbi:MAG: methylase [Methanomicrobiales archaeon HGW-Methanomicrobiales-1]|jgi:release factor glutamine methyltransferase|nr:MAG: methylase [Methanomicrobiales archaeon HGW-Methanomicrobiales-1]
MAHDPSQVYQPEDDTYLLLDAAINEVKPGDRVLEIGTGSGLISRELSKVSDVVATDINPHAALCARGDGVQVVRSDLFAGIRGTFDLIIFNPPYLPTQPEERIDDWLEYALDGGATGRDVIERFAAGVDTVLALDGRILLLISSLTGLDEVSDLFSQHGFVTRVMVAQLIEDEELYVLHIARVPQIFL